MHFDKIKALSEREKAREKLPIFYGSRDNYNHPIIEVIMNSLDEVELNFDKGDVKVDLSEDKKRITVIDSGRGIPIHTQENIEKLFLTLFTGTKLEGEMTTTGTNGCGNTVLAYTSTIMQVISRFGGTEYTLTMTNGAETIETSNKKCSKNEHGTTVIFELDNGCYTNVIFDKEEVEAIVKRSIVGTRKITNTFTHGDYSAKYYYKTVEDYFKENTKGLTSKQFANEKKLYEQNGETFEIESVIATSTDVMQETYLNLTYLKENGAIYDGFVNGVKLALNKYCREAKKFPKGITSFVNSDIEDSLSFVVVALSNKVEFQNQTKFSTEKKLYKELAQKYGQECIKSFQEKNLTQFKKLVDHILLVQKHNEKNTKAKAQLKKQLTEKVDTIGNKVNGLVDCKKHDENSEIYIAEGNSALGSIVLARNADYQAAIALRGKFLNCLKETYDEIFKNKVIMDLIKVLGCGIEADRKNKDLDTFDINNLRYGNIFIATDADPDGYQIQCLILTMIYRLMPTLIKLGRVHIVLTPLYEVKLKNGELVYIFNEEEKAGILAQHEGQIRNISRAKGLGELDAQTMAETGLDKDTRNTVQVTVETVEKMVEKFEVWMGKPVEPRKLIIETELSKYIDEVE